MTLLLIRRFWRETGLVLMALALFACTKYAVSQRDARIRAQDDIREIAAIQAQELVRHNDRVAAMLVLTDSLRAETSRLRQSVPASITKVRTLYATDTLRMPSVVDTLIQECETCVRRLADQDRQIAELTRLLREKPLTVTKVEHRSCAVPLTIGLLGGGIAGTIAGYSIPRR